MKKLTKLILALIFTIMFIPGAWANTDSLYTAEFNIGSNKYTINKTIHSMDVAPFIQNGRTYVPIRYLAYSCGLTDDGIKWEQATKTVTLSDHLISLKLRVGDPILHIANSSQTEGNQTKQMDVSPLLKNDRVYLPARYVAEALDFEIAYDSVKQSVLIYSANQNTDDYKPAALLKSITAQRAGDTMDITVKSEKDPLNYKAYFLNSPERLVIDLQGIAPGEVPQSLNVDSPLIKSVRVGWFSKNPDITRIVIDLKDRIRYKLIPSTDAKQLRIVLSPRSHSISGAVIVLDPGHGGRDPGAIGPTGLLEKDINFAIAQKTAQYLRAQGATVILTRTSDTFVELADRAELANKSGADLFLSIHCNAFTRSDVAGTSTYHIRSQLDGMEDLRDMSVSLAKSVQSSLLGNLQRYNRGVLQADFAVLTRSQVPAALAEIAFLSNPEEERLLGDPVFQDKVAKAFVQGIEDYLSNYN